jgi:hypothetical protein
MATRAQDRHSHHGEEKIALSFCAWGQHGGDGERGGCSADADGCLVGAGVSVTRVEVALDGIWQEAKLGPSAG